MASIKLSDVNKLPGTTLCQADFFSYCNIYSMLVSRTRPKLESVCCRFVITDAMLRAQPRAHKIAEKISRALASDNAADSRIRSVLDIVRINVNNSISEYLFTKRG